MATVRASPVFGEKESPPLMNGATVVGAELPTRKLKSPDVKVEKAPDTASARFMPSSFRTLREISATRTCNKTCWSSITESILITLASSETKRDAITRAFSEISAERTLPVKNKWVLTAVTPILELGSNDLIVFWTASVSNCTCISKRNSSSPSSSRKYAFVAPASKPTR